LPGVRFFDQFEAGMVVLAARAAIRASGKNASMWFATAPAHR
jgi:hypothetical protein